MLTTGIRTSTTSVQTCLRALMGHCRCSFLAFSLLETLDQENGIQILQKRSCIIPESGSRSLSDKQHDYSMSSIIKEERQQEIHFVPMFSIVSSILSWRL